MQNPRIHYTKPSITDLEARYTTDADAAANGWGDSCYAQYRVLRGVSKALRHGL